MTEAEIAELIFTTGSIVLDSTMNISTIFFAYVICAHLVGRNLSREIAVSITVVYSMFLVSSVLTMRGGMASYFLLASEYRSLYPDGILEPNMLVVDSTTFYYLAALGPSLLAWALSIIYLHFYVRRTIRTDQ